MKHAVYLSLIVASIFLTYKVTSLLMQEVLGAIYIDGQIANYEADTKILNALELKDYDRAAHLTRTVRNNEREIVRELVKALEEGKFTRYTDEKIEKGKSFLEKTENVE